MKTYTITFRRGRKTKKKQCRAKDFFAAALMAMAIKSKRYAIISVRAPIKRNRRKKSHTILRPVTMKSRLQLAARAAAHS